MQEPEILGARAERAPMRQRGLEQDIGTNHIGVDEIRGPIDRSIDMTFRRQVHDRVGLKIRENVGDGRMIADIGLAEMITRMALNRSERGKIASIGQLVDDERLVIGVSDKMSDQCRPDETRSTTDDDLHLCFLCDYRISRTVNGPSGWPSYANGLTNSLRNGSRPSLSEVMISASLNGHGIPMSGSLQRIPLSYAGA